MDVHLIIQHQKPSGLGVYDSKEEELLNRTLQMSLVSETEETDRYKIKTLQNLNYKLTLISLPSDWLVWYRDNLTTFILPSLRDRNISIDLYLGINCFLSTNAHANGQSISISANLISDIRQIELILCEISSKYTSRSNNNSHEYHIHQAKEHITEAVSDLEQNGEVEIHSSDIEKLQFIICQLENTLIPKNRRRYNVITQIMAIKTHLILLLAIDIFKA